MQGVKGIDVSRYQGDIDWTKVRSAGVGFAMIKALQGASAVDKCFAANAEGAAEAGVPFGVYVYSKAKTKEEAGEEARSVLALTRDMELAYPIAIDIESEHYRTLSEDTRAGIVDAFCEVVRAADRLPMIYSSKDWLENVIPKSCLENRYVWLAQWRKTDPDYKGPFAMWQYGRGDVDGIPTKADMDICPVDFPALTAAIRPLVFAVKTPLMRGAAVKKMQLALIAANYTDNAGVPLDPDGVWGKKSQQALDKLVKTQSRYS